MPAPAFIPTCTCSSGRATSDRVEQIEAGRRRSQPQALLRRAPRVGDPRGRVPEPAVREQAAQEHRGAAVLRRLPPRHRPAGARAADHRLALSGRRVPAAQRRRGERLPRRAPRRRAARRRGARAPLARLRGARRAPRRGRGRAGHARAVPQVRGGRSSPARARPTAPSRPRRSSTCSPRSRRGSGRRPRSSSTRRTAELEQPVPGQEGPEVVRRQGRGAREA